MQQQQQRRQELLQGFDIHKLEQIVKTRWLKPKEVLQILLNHELFKVEDKNPQKPPSGSVFLFNRRVLRYFRVDGYEWRKKKNGKTSAEAHEHLKVDNVKVLNCYYAHADQNPAFRRRIYWMLEPAYEHIVLVHYRDVQEGIVSVSVLNDASPSNQNDSASRCQTLSSPGSTSELIASYLHSCSPGSGEEISYEIVEMNNETNNTSESDFQAKLRTLKMQLSLEDKEHRDDDIEGVLPNHESNLVHGVQNEELDTSINLADIYNELDITEDNHTEGSHPYLNAIDVLKNSDSWLEDDQLEAILHPAPVIVNEIRWFSIHEVSPEWAFCSQSTKVIIAGDFLCDSSNCSWAILFGDVKVPAEIVQHGVIRCHTPCLGTGKVRMCMVDENGKPSSETREFEFHEKPTKNIIDGNKSCTDPREVETEIRQKPSRSSDDLPFLLKYVDMLFDGQGRGLFSKFRLPLPDHECGFQVDPSEITKITCDQLDHENTVNRVMEVLLNNKLDDWLSSKCDQTSECNYLLPKQYHCVIHTIAALGYKWALKPLLNSGVPINYRDTNGWTALHWAARFDRKEMVVALLAEGAAAGALSDPTCEDPAAKTPASIAGAYGLKGLSAFLSEAELTAHLHSLESTENRASRDSISDAVDRISDEIAHLNGTTDDQLALKDSLRATQNVVQAAGRIQAAFRIFSFKKKQDMSIRNEHTYVLSIRKASATSRAVLDKAALSIQKNFRCWKNRKEFLKIRKYVIKIQAQIRAHQERNKYKDLLRSVGILEKAMLRWYRKGVGLRGFSSGAMPIDDDEDDDIIRVFRKERVETAINEAVLRVSNIVSCPIARLEYRRVLEMHRQAKHEHGN